MNELKSFGAMYWEGRYGKDKFNSGRGSYGCSAEFKAKVINDFIAERCVQSVIDFGCGDGNQISLLACPKYLGFDISQSAVDMCRTRMTDRPEYEFKPLAAYSGETAELALSLDVLYHIIESDVFRAYLRRLFAAATKYVMIFAVDREQRKFMELGVHVCYRRFNAWILDNISGWRLVATVDNPCGYETRFYIYEKL